MLDVVRLGVAAVLISGMGVSTVLTLVGAASWPLFLVLWSAAAVAGLIWVLRRRQPGGLAGRGELVQHPRR